MNYTEIVDLALSYADRSDTEVSSRMDAFLRIVEAKISRRLAVMNMSVRTLLATQEGQEFYTLPTDYAGLRDIEIREDISSSSRSTLQYLSPEQMNNFSSLNKVYGSGRGKGVYYTLVTNQIQIQPIQAGGKVLEIIYYRKVIPLSPIKAENWVSLSDPDLYVFGLLVEISSFTKDAGALQIWQQRFEETLEAVEVDDSDSRWAGTALQIRLG